MTIVGRKETAAAKLRETLSRISDRIEDEWNFEFGALTLSTEKLVDTIHFIREIVSGLDAPGLETVSLAVLNSATKSANQLAISLDEVKSFMANDSDPVSTTQNRWAETVDQLYAKAFHFDDQARPLIAQFPMGQEKLDEQVAAASRESDAIKKLRQEFEKEREEFTAAVTAARSVSGQKGVEAHEEIFRKEADGHERGARRWIKWAAAFGAAILGCAIASPFIPLPTPTWTTPFGYSLQFILAKGVFFSTLIGGLAVAVRNHRAHLHNAAVNRHRQNALSTYPALLEAARDDDEAKMAVLLLTTQAIVAASVSGYIPKEPEGVGPSQMIDVLRRTNARIPPGSSGS